MIRPKTPKLTLAEERRAYATATKRDRVCVLCRRGGEPQRHHREGRDRFNTVPSNLILACRACHHERIHAHPEWARSCGFIVPGWAVPAGYPVMYWLPTAWGTLQQGWVLLDDIGNMREIGEGEAVRRVRGDWPGVRKGEAA